MNRIVREHYPVANLPEDLRAGLEPRADVTVTVEIDVSPVDGRADPTHPAPDIVSASMWVARGKEVRQANFASGEDVDDYLRRLRD